jgi:hypothetical protein
MYVYVYVCQLLTRCHLRFTRYNESETSMNTDTNTDLKDAGLTGQKKPSFVKETALNDQACMHIRGHVGIYGFIRLLYIITTMRTTRTTGQYRTAHLLMRRNTLRPHKR